MKLGKILIIAPHPDDEVLGCGGIMAKYTNNISILYITGFHPGVDNKEYQKEKLSVLKRAKINRVYNSTFELETNKLDSIPISSIISRIESTINFDKPDTVFVCFPSYNQDHRVVYDATITATRPHDTNHFVKNILVYEQPETLHSQRIGSEVFKPQLFVPIDIEEKIELYSLYKTQIRGHRKPETLKGLAALRGSYINKDYAEAFSIVRISCE